jgi:cyclopropane fatty-acyl-phospholipid synthase-like methyltransferase
VDQDSLRGRQHVARYYDSNTRRFLAFGGGGRSRSIHRALWGPGISDTHAAANYINVLIGDAVDMLRIGPDVRLLDFGCGVGGSLFALAGRFPEAILGGVTISRDQYELARRFADQLALESRCQFYCGDFESIDLDFQADVVVAVESMVHSRSLTAFVENAARHLRPGGALIVVDDFVARAAPLNSGDERVLAGFRAGWRLTSLTTVAAFVATAQSAGFVLDESLDLSPMIRLNRPRDRVIAATSPLLRRFTAVPMFANLVGGAALTRGTRIGLLGYRWLRFKR